VIGAARDVVHRLMARHRVPGLSLAVTDAERLLFAEGFGEADLAARRPVTPETRFLWFSMSKIATATAAMVLVDAGQLDLDAPVDSVVPGFRTRQGARPVIRQLLNHTSGTGNPLPLRWILPADSSPDDARAAEAAILARHGRPRRVSGGPARYSNIGFLILAQVIERAGGQRFEDFVRRAVLEPAGMSATGYAVPADGDLATGYVRLPRPFGPLLRAIVPAEIVGERHGDQVALRPFRVAGAGYGGLIGPASDAARLLRLHLADGEIDGKAPACLRRRRLGRCGRSARRARRSTWGWAGSGPPPTAARSRRSSSTGAPAAASGTPCACIPTSAWGSSSWRTRPGPTTTPRCWAP
jgi:CubicO group peptidase (beta-lactamase class C family)